MKINNKMIASTFRVIRQSIDTELRCLSGGWMVRGAQLIRVDSMPTS